MKQWCIPKAGAKFVAKMEDVLEVYARPYNPTRPVICVDEKSKELHSEVRESIPAKPGKLKRVDHEYRREGTANIFLWVEPLAGRRGVKVTDQRRKVDFAEFLCDLAEREYADATKIVLVTDNLNTHGPHSLYERYPAEQAFRLAQKFEWHYTPEHGSWLNIAECELSVMACQCTNRRIPDKIALANKLAAWELDRNTHTAKIIWHFTASDSRIKLRRLYPVIEFSNQIN